LFHLAAAGKHLQERSALALLGDVFDRFKDSIVADGGNWFLAPVDFWSDALQQELIGSEESGQQGAITHAYASVDAHHGAQLPDDLKRMLCAVVLASKMGLKAADRDDAVKALSALAGLDENSTDRGVRLLQDEYNVLEWDESFKEFDILGDAVPRTQFLSFVRRRVASAYDERGKATLFAGKASQWCDLLGDMECDFAEENKIMTREWRYQGMTSNLDLLPMQLKLASDQWSNAIGVDDPRGIIIYCYVEPSRDSAVVESDTLRLLRARAREAQVPALPILVVLLCDETGELGQALAELAVLEESISEEDKARFRNLIPAHAEKMRHSMRSQIEAMIKKRHYVTCLSERVEAQRLSQVGTEVFSQIYTRPLTFPFDGFSTAKGNAADSCQELTTDLLIGKLDYDAAMAKPVKVKNRAVTVLGHGWEVFAQNGSVRRRPSHPVVRALTEKWDDMLVSGERRLPLGQALRQLCMPPYGANIASAGLFLGVFVAPRVEKIVVVRHGQQHAVSRWVQDGVFRGKFIDIGGLHDVDLVLLGEESSEWEVLLDEWEQAESYSARVACFTRANDLKARVPIPPSLSFRELHLEEQGQAAVKALGEIEKQQDEAVNMWEAGYRQKDAGLISRGAAILSGLIERMTREQPLWTDRQIDEIKPDYEHARQAVIQCFAEWLANQAPKGATPDAVGDFKHRMLRLVGGNLRKIGLSELFQELETRTGQIVRNAETAADAHKLVIDVGSWLTSHADVLRLSRVAEIRGLLEVGKDFLAKLRGMSERIQMPEIGEARNHLSEALAKMKDAESDIVKRATRLWRAKLRSEDDLDVLLNETDELRAAFENCPTDLEDLHLMRRTLRIYQKDFQQLADSRLTWAEFENLAQKMIQEVEDSLGEDEVPWLPQETITGFVDVISKRRKETGTAWIESIESESSAVSSMSAADANRLHTRASAPPAVLTDQHANRLKEVLREIETRLDSLKIDWLLEKFLELPPPLRKKFLQLVTGKEDGISDSR
jgi:hypothetical protein